jgi:hypothetical protein
MRSRFGTLGWHAFLQELHSDAIVYVELSNSSRGSLYPTRFLFTPLTWDEPQTVRLARLPHAVTWKYGRPPIRL